MKLVRRLVYWGIFAFVTAELWMMIAAVQTAAPKQSAAVRPAIVRQESEPMGYVLRETDGHLAVYRENGLHPYQILDVETWLLSEQDRHDLEEGIYLRTEQELRTLLEDWDADLS